MQGGIIQGDDMRGGDARGVSQRRVLGRRHHVWEEQHCVTTYSRKLSVLVSRRVQWVFELETKLSLHIIGECLL